MSAVARDAMPGFDLGGFLCAEAAAVDEALAWVAEHCAATFPAALAAPVGYTLGTRGKRLRPILCVAAYRVASGRREAAEPALYRFACATELVHTYSLVHDDLPCMDDDDLRRGRPTVHRVHGAAAALLAGAALLPLAVELVVTQARALGVAQGEAARLVGGLCEAVGARGMVGGQHLDLEAEASDASGSTDAARLEAIHRAKTGALLTASLWLGAAAGGADAPLLEALTRYGAALGLAFQIADDVLDVTAETTALGKTAARDLALGKVTYPSLFGVDGARALARARADEAVAALGAAGIASPALHALAHYVVERPH